MTRSIAWCSRSPARRNPRSFRQRSIRANPKNRRDSLSIFFAPDARVDSAHESPQSPGWLDQDEFNPIAQRDDVNLLPGADPERLSYIAWNHYLELGRDSYRCHRFSYRSQYRITLYHRWVLRTTYPATI